MHVAYVRKDGHKMSKSLGNLVFVSDLRRAYDPRAIRLGVLEHHYRHSWEWDDGLMDRASVTLDRWLGAADPARPGRRSLADVRAALDDDLDTPGAVAAIDDAIDRGDGIIEAAALIGIDLLDARHGPR
jgi:L-cysteine:1D-myo-inositol 2-amino-2-deoxy-alpha-D-glucopyranoside ligase